MNFLQDHAHSAIFPTTGVPQDYRQLHFYLVQFDGFSSTDSLQIKQTGGGNLGDLKLWLPVSALGSEGGKLRCPLFLPVPCSCTTLLCGVYGGLVTLLSVVAAHTTVITGHIAVLLVDSTSPQRSSRQHTQGIRVHVLLVDTLAERCCRRCHLLLEAVACNCDRCLGAQHM